MKTHLAVILFTVWMKVCLGDLASREEVLPGIFNCFDARTTWTISDLMESKVLGDEKGNDEDDPLQPFYEKMLIEMIESDSELEFFIEPERRLKFKNKGLSINDLPPLPHVART